MATLLLPRLHGFAEDASLGFVTHAVGVRLPFAVYTGMTSTIAVTIGPVGWLSAGLWAGWRLTSPTWSKIVPTVLYIAARRLPTRLRMIRTH